ncbi:hypothetical protein [Actinoallomurus sp. CA-150999]
MTRAAAERDGAAPAAARRDGPMLGPNLVAELLGMVAATGEERAAVRSS